MIINRESYIKQLEDKKQNGMIKIITGLRRSGKSFLLFELFYKRLLESGVADDHIIRIPHFLKQEMKIFLRHGWSIAPMGGFRLSVK